MPGLRAPISPGSMIWPELDTLQLWHQGVWVGGFCSVQFNLRLCGGPSSPLGMGDLGMEQLRGPWVVLMDPAKLSPVLLALRPLED